MIITEISKEVENNNNIARLNVYEKEYVRPRNGAVGGSYGGLNLATVCVYTFVCVGIKTKRETVALGMFENVQTMLV